MMMVLEMAEVCVFLLSSIMVFFLLYPLPSTFLFLLSFFSHLFPFSQLLYIEIFFFFNSLNCHVSVCPWVVWDFFFVFPNFLKCSVWSFVFHLKFFEVLCIYVNDTFLSNTIAINFCLLNANMLKHWAAPTLLCALINMLALLSL